MPLSSRPARARFAKPACAGIALAMAFWACAGSGGQMYVPEDIPDVCRDLDFRRDVELRKICGVGSRDYLAYRNIPEHRNMLEPKAGKIIQKGRSLQLRLENFLPVDLPSDFEGKIRFGEDVRRSLVKSKMDYFEFFPPQATRPERLIRLDIPLDNGESKSVCFAVERKTPTMQRKTGSASTLLPLSCQDFARLKSQVPGPDGKTSTAGSP